MQSCTLLQKQSFTLKNKYLLAAWHAMSSSVSNHGEYGHTYRSEKIGTTEVKIRRSPLEGKISPNFIAQLRIRCPWKSGWQHADIIWKVSF